MDLVTIFGLIVALVGIIGGMILEGGHLASIAQLTAAVIVIGGTLGAVLVSTTREDLKTGLRLLRLGFGRDPEAEDPDETLEELVSAAQLARKESILALESRIPKFKSSFMQNVCRFAIDGVDPAVLRETFESQLEIEEENLVAGAKIYVDAGGYAPTIGIIGAVLGLIHVMENLTDTSKLGSGIAVAFVATVYGVASANIIFLPLGAKIKRKIRRRIEIRRMIVQGIVGIASGLSPFIIEQQLKAFVHLDQEGKKLGAS